MFKFIRGLGTNGKSVRPNGYLAIGGLRRDGIPLKIKTWMQHHLHPMHLWTRLGSHCLKCFRQYETHIWQPLVRRWLKGGLSALFFARRTRDS